ncbi:Lar family restriction alleviation protein [Vibrio cholerae]|nr:hypothetical protein [Vibrio cholerae]EKF9600405.1 Lar family restriction alleviation protein [Vibrio cholerae]
MGDSKNCPFCRGKPKIYIGPDHLWRVICSNIWTCGAKTVGFEQKHDAIDAWDTRAETEEITTILQQNAELVESLKNMKRIVDNRPDSHYLEVFERAEVEDANELLQKIKSEKYANRN